MTGVDQSDCGQITDLLDFYLDRELPASEMMIVASHLEGCVACREEEAARLALRLRLRKAARSAPVPDHLPGRGFVNSAVPKTAPRRNAAYLALAAAALLTVSVSIYGLRDLRSSVASQDSYISEISAETPAILQVGLKDHVHCAVFRKFPDSPPSVEDMTAKLGPEYADLLPMMKGQLPAGMNVALAHKCKYRGRQYVHLVARNGGGHLVSLVIARREDGEAFEGDLRAVVTGSDIPLYSAGVREFSIAGFETPGHLVYLVSDMDQKNNLHMMNSMAAQVTRVLSRIEG